MSKGVIFTGDAADRIARVVKIVERDPINLTSPGGDIPRDADGSVGLLNQTGSTVQRGSIAWCRTRTRADVFDLEPPQYPGAARVVVLDGDILNNQAGRGFSGDLTAVQLRLNDYAGTAVGDTVGPWFSIYTAVVYPGGPWRVLAKLDSPFALVIRLTDRLDNKMVLTGGQSPGGAPYKVLVFASGHTVTQDSPGNLTATAP